MALPQNQVRIIKYTQTSANQATPVETSTVLYEGSIRIVRVPNDRLYTIFGDYGRNGRAKYCIYLETHHPDIYQDKNERVEIEFNLIGREQKAIFMLAQPMTIPVMNRKAELYFESVDQ